MGESTISLGLGLGGAKLATSSGRPGGGGGAFSNSASVLLDGTDERMVLDSEISLSGACTVSFWTKPLSGNEAFFMTGVAGTGGGFYLVWYGPAYGNQLIVRDANLVINTGTDTLTGSSWSHVALIRDSSDNVKAYINGVQRGPTDSSGATTTVDIQYLGSNKTSAGNSLHGNMDEIALWDSDQTSNLADIYNSGSSGTTIADQGSGGVDCELVNSPSYSTDVPS